VFRGAAPISVRGSINSVLARPRVFLENDFSSLLTFSTQKYKLKVSGTPELAIPISSWQATLQTDRQSFLQVVIPNASEYAADLSARAGTETFTVFGVGEVGNFTIENAIASCGIDSLVVNSGPTRSTATISGYTDAFSADDAVAGLVGLVNIQQVNTTSTGARRIRCAINWLLRPGQEVQGGGYTFTASYINYFVTTTGQAYMDVGSRGAG